MIFLCGQLKKWRSKMSAQVHRMNAFSFLEDERHFKLQKTLGNVSFQQLLGT